MSTCQATRDIGGRIVRCEMPAGHEGAHSADIYLWWSAQRHAATEPERPEWRKERAS